jgi:hypothetical protein
LLLVGVGHAGAAFSAPPHRTSRLSGHLRCTDIDEGPAPLRRPLPVPYSRSEVDILRSRVLRLENILRDVCGAVMYCDDLALLEREAAGVGKIFRDASFTESRKPMFARVALQSVVSKHGLSATPPMHTWTREIPE